MIWLALLAAFGPFVAFSAWGMWDARRWRRYIAAMDLLPPLTVTISADISGFVEAMEKAQQSIAAFGRSIARSEWTPAQYDAERAFQQRIWNGEQP